MKNITVKKLTMGAIIAALYTALTLIVAPISFGPVQLRLSEAMTVLPAICPPATVGLTLGCFISNIFGFILGANPLGLIDALVGTTATFLAALMTAYIGKKCRGAALYLLAPLPPVLLNALFVGAELCIVVIGDTSVPTLLATCLYVGLGEAIACYLGGSALLKGSYKYFTDVFKK
ncbi:MAG: QueT transporter family protein [Oscillospiraceae bacterium]|nr:QueT transporter family protein [Oscillospiraceae bacterium]